MNMSEVRREMMSEKGGWNDGMISDYSRTET